MRPGELPAPITSNRLLRSIQLASLTPNYALIHKVRQTRAYTVASLAVHLIFCAEQLHTLLDAFTAPRPVVVLYIKSSCRHCHHMRHPFGVLAALYADHFSFALVDCDHASKHLCSHRKLATFPSIGLHTVCLFFAALLLL